MRGETRGAWPSSRAAWKNKPGIITVNLRRRHADRFRRGRLAREPVPVETSQICPPRVRDAIIGARAAFERADVRAPADLAFATEAAEVMGSLTESTELAQALLARPVLARAALTPEQTAGIVGQGATEIAGALLRLGTLGLPRGWSPAQGLDPRQAETLRKMLLAVEQLFDVRAVRLVVASIPECYAALGIVHGLWPYIPGEFDDYVATPKGNGYRSIHTAVIGPHGRSVEVQIRTAEMHEHAELGVAAHWTYKEGGLRDAQYQRKIEWVRRLLAPHDGLDAGAIADRELSRIGVRPEQLGALTAELKAPDTDHLYQLLGEGEITVTQLVQAAMRLTEPPRPPLRPARPAATRRRASPVEIEGVGDLPTTLGRCCSPLRPPPIAGYPTLGRGVTVHRSDCAGFQRMSALKPDRVLNVEWSSAESGALAVELAVSAYDRRGLLRDLTDVLAVERLSIDATSSRTDHDAGIAYFDLSVAVDDLEQLARVP